MQKSPFVPRSLLLIASFTWFAVSAAHGLTRDDLLFYAPLDGSLDAAVARGESRPIEVRGKPEFVEGRHGQGLLVGAAGNDVAYGTAGNMDLDAGSIAMWVKAVDWTKDSYMRFFFRVGEAEDAGGPGNGNFLWLYKYFDYSVCWLVQQDTPQRVVYLVRPATGDKGGAVPFDWEAGKWTHLIGAWAGNQLNLYINGQYVGTAYIPSARLLRKLAGVFRLGGANSRAGGTADTVIDEVMILRQPVTPGEARLLYEKGLDALTPASPEPRVPLLQIEAGGWPSKHAISLASSLVGFRPDDLQGLSLSYQIVNSKNSKRVSHGRWPITDFKQTKFVDVRKLPLGSFSLEATLQRGTGETALAQAKTEFEKLPPAEWVGNRLGILDHVPAPWTAIERHANGLSCWGRTYDWGGGLFPQHVTTQGRELLEAPIHLVAVVDDKPCEVQRARIRWNKVTPTRADFLARGTLGRDIPVEVRGWMEYDGFVWSRIRIGDGKGGGRHFINLLALEIPMRSEMATLMQGRPPLPASGKTVNFNGSLWAAPFLWFGNEHGGLQWCTEDTRDWLLEDAQKMVSFTAGERQSLLRLGFIDHKVRLDRALEYTVGLDATPVKPMNPERRTWEMALATPYCAGGKPRRLLINEKTWQSYTCANCGAPPCTYDEHRPAWCFYWSNWNAIGSQTDGPYGYQVASPATFAGLRLWRTKNTVPWIYWAIHSVWLGDPVLRAYGGEWGGTYEDPARAHPYSDVTVNHDDPAVRDYLVWLNWKLLHDHPELADAVGGYYNDCAQAIWTLQGRRPGSPYNLYTILGTRELQKRFYGMIKQWPRLLVSNHQSGDMHMPQLAFADMTITGEHLTGDPRIVNDIGYYHVLTLDGMRAEYIGSNLGIPTIFLPETGRSVGGDLEKLRKVYSPEGIGASEHLVGMLWVHDVMPYFAYTNPDPLLQAARAKDAFGWDRDTKFVGYWENEGLVQTRADQSPVVTSIFVRGDKVLFVVMNNSDHEARVELTPHWKKLGIQSPSSVVDAYAEQALPSVSAVNVPVSNGRVQFSVKARNFRTLVVR